eukprot:9215039-Pyramimonas_sp.AAC.1
MLRKGQQEEPRATSRGASGPHDGPAMVPDTPDDLGIEGAGPRADGGRADGAQVGHDPTDDEGPSGPPLDPELPPDARRRRVDFNA